MKFSNKLKGVGPALGKLIPKRGERGEAKTKVPKATKSVSSGQFSEKLKDQSGQFWAKLKNGLNMIGQKVNFAKVGKIAVLVVAGLFVLACIATSIFAYSTKSKGDLKVTKRDTWIEKASTVLPLPAATVNNQFISLHEFYQQVSYLKHFNTQVSDSLSEDAKTESALRKKVLSNLVESEAIEQEAVKNGVKVTKADVEKAFESAASANGGNEEIKKVLQKYYGMTVDQFKGLIKTQLYSEKVQEKLLTQVHIKHILLTDEAKANEALSRIQKGESFEDVAKSVSEDSNSKEDGGDLGWLSRDDLKDNISADFETAVMKLKKGETSAVIKTKYGYHIVKIVEKKGKVDKSYADWKTELVKKAKVKKFVKS